MPSDFLVSTYWRYEMDDIFHSVGSKLVGAYPYSDWSEAPWLNLQKSEFIPEESTKIFDTHEKPLRPVLEQAIQTWLKEGTWSPLTDIQAFFLGIRIDTVACFLLTISTPDNILECSEKNEVIVAKWFLTTWWNHHGTNMYFYNRFSQ